jgi:cyanophycinase
MVVVAALVLAASYGNPAGDQALGQGGDQVSGQITGQINDQISGQISGQTNSQTSGRISDRTSGQVTGPINNPTSGQPVGQDAPEYGPSKGTLVIVGGGSLEGTGIYEKFIQLAGGPDASFVVVPTAGGNKNPDGTIRAYREEQVVAGWLKRGVKNVKMLHTHDPKVADTEEFAKILRTANAVWFDGGRQWNIVDSYMNTLTYKEFHKVLERGGVIGGSSAGATIQGDYLVRGAVAGAQIMMTPEKEHEHGFAFLRKSAIDQHINTRNRWDDLTDVIRKMPTLLGIGLSEGTAIIVSGDTFDVIGKWKVAIHDNTRLYQPWEKPYYVLSAGDVYNMKTRKIVKFGTGAAPARGGGRGGF